MKEYLHNAIPNLQPFDYLLHHDDLFIDQQWVLVNGISEKKSIYTFRKDNILEIRNRILDLVNDYSDINFKNIKFI